MHLILPHAASPQWPASALDALALPHLQRLLADMPISARLHEPEGESPHPLMPHEQVEAQARGWPRNGPWPWAALATAEPDSGAQAWITPCHWQVGMDQVVMRDPHELQLSDAESQALLQAIQPYMQDDGLQVRWHDALHWHAQGPLLGGLAPASLARVSGQNVRPWVMDGSLPAALRRLQSELQMLLYHHPVNEAREARGQATVNAFWVHGAGALSSAHTTHTGDPVRCLHLLSAPARQGDLAAWQAAWTALDREVLAPLASSTEPLTLTLCSDTTAHSYTRRPRPWWRRLFARPDARAALHALLTS
ncbi:MAG: hypothetical protein RL559_952 [Pseudomonadota bacterium]